MSQELDFWGSWMDFLSQNWQWFIPVVATMTAPLLATGINILYDYMKIKRWI